MVVVLAKALLQSIQQQPIVVHRLPRRRTRKTAAERSDKAQSLAAPSREPAGDTNNRCGKPLG